MRKEIDKRLNVMTLGAIVLDLIFIVLGIFFATDPEITTTVANILIAIVLMVSGIYALIKFIMNMNENIVFTFELIYGILSFVAGIVIMTNPLSLTGLITIFVGIWFIISGAIKASVAIRFKRFKEDSWLINLTIAILTIIIGILLLVNPFRGALVLSTYVGIMLIIYASMDIVEKILLRKRAKNIEKILFRK